MSNFNDGQDNYNNGWSGGAPDPKRGAVGDQWHRFGQEAKARHERSLAEANKPLNFGGGSGSRSNPLGGLMLLAILIAIGFAVFGRHATDAPAGAASSAPGTITITPTAADPAASPAIPAPTAAPAVPTTQAAPSAPRKAPADLDGLY